MLKFKLHSKYQPQGDQPRAIQEIVSEFQADRKYQTLLGVTGSGKTFTMANIITNLNLPTLVISHNKTLAAQLYGEFRSFFPENAVEFFISYYDYYQPEAYVPSSDTFIEKDASINDEIDRLRLRATSSLLARKDVVIVSSVSCIYGLGSPEDYQKLLVIAKKGEKVDRNEILLKLIDIHYSRNDFDFQRGTFRVRGDVVDIFPAYEEYAIRLEFFGNEIEQISTIDTVTGEVKDEMSTAIIYPARHFVTTEDKMERAMITIREELEEQLKRLREQNKLLEAQRLEMRTNFDLEMMAEVGYCSGIENYSRHISGRKPGQPPYTLLDFFPEKYLVLIDECHQSIPQIRAMYNGDRSRKETLVEHGFRLPSALDNRPLKFHEFEGKMPLMLFVSATPAEYELTKSEGVIVEQVIRPTGLVDPVIEVRPIKTQIDDLIGEIRERVDRKERTLITTLTKRMAEDLTDYLRDMNINVRYLHSEINALERVDILRDLRLAQFDVLVGINLLREGLDLPEVSLVAVLDADKEGFLRSYVSLMQTAGRAARNVGGKVIFYADRMTDSMKKTIDETNRRREKQAAYNKEHGITAQTIYKTAEEILATTRVADVRHKTPRVAEPIIEYGVLDKDDLVERLTKEMQTAAANLEFERAAIIRDEIKRIKTNK
ncbi:MAG: excinuclease ABC subunit UvrB [Calditrichia bacterium]|nr:excinuclease ABC subunit UvrB [Calditrichia bacterium]